MKVAIIGAGDVGATSALRIAEAGLANVVLVDILEGRAYGKALDLTSAASITRHSNSIVGTSDYKQISGSDIVVVTCGQTRSPGQSRESLLANNAKIVKDVAGKIAKYCPDSIIIVVTNPLDTLAHLALKTSGFPANRVIGMGGVSDCARFNMLAGAELQTASFYVHSTIIGPHSDKMVILPRFSTVLGIPLTELLPQDRIKRIVEETRGFGGQSYPGPGQGQRLLRAFSRGLGPGGCHHQ